MTLPLAGIRVLDLSRVLAGPFSTQTLADLGADVIKIERPGSGDDTRSWGPPYARDDAGKETSESSYFLAANRGKKSVAVDFTTEQGQTLISALAEQSDIVIENFKVGHLARYGLDAASLRRLNPRLIYCSITGFGQTGPYRDLPGYDFLIQGMGGLMSVTGEPHDQPASRPIKAGIAVADLVTGLYSTIAILASLNRRTLTGEGETIDMALLDCQVSMLANQAINFLTTGIPPQRLGNGHPNIVPYETFATSDGHMILAVGNDSQFAAFCGVIDKPDWAHDPRFSTNRRRVENRASLSASIQPIVVTQPMAHWLDACSRARVPAGPINRIDQVFADPQVIDRGLQLSLFHPLAGTVPSIACPIRFADASAVKPSAPPLLGQHTDDVLESRLGLSATDIAALRADGIVA